jgi:hypothetical protein
MEFDPLKAAIANLADQTDTEPDDIEVVSHEIVTWRNGSVGCPEAGYLYPQQPVAGFRIILRAGDTQVVYHGQRGQSPFRCDHPDPDGILDTRPIP